MALGVHSHASIVIHAHLRQMLVCFLGQMGIDLYAGKSIRFTFSKGKGGRWSTGRSVFASWLIEPTALKLTKQY
jgi:hypothetical protein